MALKVVSTDLHILKNAVENHTDRFELLQNKSTAIFRRGQSFDFSITFDRAYDKITDIVRIVMETGPIPALANGTSVTLDVEIKEKLIAEKWDARFSNFENSTVIVQVQIAPSAPVSVWKINVDTVKDPAGVNEINRHEINMAVYVLFNPWCLNDGVYLNDKDQLDEYVLNENGKVWRGTFEHHNGYSWFFGQFKSVVLLTIMELLDKSSVSHQDRADPVKMTRWISAITNSNDDDDGLIVGRWYGSYEEGTPPHAWIGSIAIFEEYQKLNKPVKFGQCWVFSGVLVTICRALGIPCRSVTNFESGHDEDASLTIDTYDDSNTISETNGTNHNEGCWNFHVWNDVWIDRPDLPKGYGGWQCIDGTPQEKSDGISRCGPAPLEAIRRGEVDIGYDTMFVFAEVRGDRCRFESLVVDGSEVVIPRIKPNCIGKLIATKKISKTSLPGDNEDMEDITHLYKNIYDSLEDKMAMKRAIKMVKQNKNVYKTNDKQIEDVKFELYDNKKITLGENFKIKIAMHNTSSESRSVFFEMSASLIRYTGTKLNKFMSEKMKIDLSPNTGKNTSIMVPPLKYVDKMVANNLIRITVLAIVNETKQMWGEDNNVVIQMPELKLILNSKPQKNKQCEAIFAFNNTISVKLTNCTFSIDGPGIHKVIKFRDVLPNELNVTHKEVFTPGKKTDDIVTVSFNSNQIADIHNSITFEVLE